MPADSYKDRAARYAADVLSGRVVAGRLVRLAIERNERDLRHGKDRGLWLDDAAGAHACEFYPRFLRHSKGKWARTPVALEDWEVWWIYHLFGWKRADGTRRFRISYGELARKNGKSLIAAGVGLYLTAADGEFGAEVYCLDPSTPVLTADLDWVPIGGLSVGDELFSIDENPNPGRGMYRKMRAAKVLGITRQVAAEAYRITIADGRQVVCSANHRWLVRSSTTSSNQRWRRTEVLTPGNLIHGFGMPWTTGNDWASGYLSAAFAGEGNLHSPGDERAAFRVCFSQKPNGMLDTVRRLLTEGGYKFVQRAQSKKSGVASVVVNGLYDTLRLLGSCRPARLYPRHREIWEGRAFNRSVDAALIVSIEKIPWGRELVDIETSSGTFFANGLISHNSAATKRDQAKIVWGEAKRMLGQSPALRRYLKALAANIHSPVLGSKYEPLGADGDTMDGLNIHGAIVDELHAHKTREVWDVITTATGARTQPLIFAITTAGSGRHSICREQHDYAVAVLEGTYPEAETDSFFALIYAIDEGDDWKDPACWIKANPNLNVSVSFDDLTEKCERAKRSPSQQNAFRRLHLNVWTEQETRWLDLDEWDACDQHVIEPEKLVGRKCYLALDLSSNRDLTALTALFEPAEEGDPWDAVTHYWCPKDTIKERTEMDRVPYDVWAEEGLIEATPGSVIDHSFMLAKAEWYKSNHDVQELAFDRWGSAQVVARLEEIGFSTEPDERKRGGAPVLVQFGQGFASMSPASKELETWILQRKINHGGHQILRWNAANVVVRMDPAGNIKPDKVKSREKIDGVVTLIMAVDRASRGSEDESVYESRGLLSIG